MLQVGNRVDVLDRHVVGNTQGNRRVVQDRLDACLDQLVRDVLGGRRRDRDDSQSDRPLLNLVSHPLIVLNDHVADALANLLWVVVKGCHNPVSATRHALIVEQCISKVTGAYQHHVPYQVRMQYAPQLLVQV